jgi:uncharacterized protein
MSTPRTIDPRHLDVAALAAAGACVSGEFELAELPRLMQDVLPPTPDSAAVVHWSARGAQRRVSGGEPRIDLQLRVETTLRLSCQRCLQPVAVVLQLAPNIRFVQGEALAEQLDEDCEDDVLALSASMDLRELIEDELILALPLVPRHEACPEPLPMSAQADDAADNDVDEHPFAALAALRRHDGAA